MPPKLPVMEIAWNAHVFPLRNFWPMLRANWLWFAWLLAIVIVVTTLASGAFRSLIVMGVAAWCAAPIAVAWHRAVLLNEAPAHFLSFHVGRRDLRYGFLVLALSMIPLAAEALAETALFGSIAFGQREAALRERASPNLSQMVVIAVLAAELLFLRLHLVLPAAALDDARIGFAQSWKLTQGNMLRLIAVSLLCALPTTLIVFAAVPALRAASEIVGHRLVLTAALAGGALWIVFLTGVGVCCMSYIYRALAPPPGDVLPEYAK